MRTALLSSRAREAAGVAYPPHVPAPVGGWNTRDSLADMPALDAYLLDNWFPRGNYLQVRGGSSSWATGMSGTVKTVFQFKPISGSDKLFGVTDAGIYDITTTGAVGAIARTLTNGLWNTVNLTNQAGTSYNWGCNGVDGPYYYDGAAWAVPTITGVTGAHLIIPWLFKHRIFAIEKNTMNAWFLPVDSIQGAASQFPLGPIFKRGGYLVSGTNWTLDAGDGPDDLCVFISSEGEIAVYAGTDPASADTFGLVGVYYVGRPLGARCFIRLGGDVIVLVESGFYQLSKLLKAGKVNFSSALTKKIQPTVTDQVKTNFSGTTWCGIVYPQFDALITNIPQPSGLSNIQYTMNTVTGAWCSFSGWNAQCFEVFNGVLYWGAPSGVVYKAWDGASPSDSGSDVIALVAQAYNYFGAASKLKKCGLFRPLLSYDGSVELRTAISADFQGLLTPASITPRSSSSTGAPWDTSPWDTTSWSVGQQLFKFWRGAAHTPGFALSLIMEALSNNCTVLQWAGTDFVLEGGGIL